MPSVNGSISLGSGPPESVLIYGLQILLMRRYEYFLRGDWGSGFKGMKVANGKEGERVYDLGVFLFYKVFSLISELNLTKYGEGWQSAR